jgi:hypothetical protein
MDFETALDVKQQIVDVLEIGGPRLRGDDRRRVAVGLAPATQSADFRIAIRAQTQEDLDHAFAGGMEAKVRTLALLEPDIRITGRIVANPPTESGSPHRQLRLGASVSHHRRGAGSLGFFARDRNGAVGIVSNNHVLALSDRGSDGDEILHPGAADNGMPPLDVVARLVGGYPRLVVDNPRVDCAFAHLRDGVPYDPVTLDTGLKLNATTVPLRDQRAVLKRGRSTGLTRGTITAVAVDNIDVEYPYPCGIVFFNQQIEITSFPGQPFSAPGDSGSLLVNPDGNPLGLVFCGSIDCRSTYANPIDDVLNALGVTVVT